MALSRRRLLQSGGAVALGALALPLLVPATAYAADEFDQLLLRHRDAMTGTTFDPVAEPFASRLAKLGADQAARLASMTPNGPALWPDLPLTASSAIPNSYGRLKSMALAYLQPGTGLTGDPDLLNAVVTGLDYMHAHIYNPSTAWFDNWYHWNLSGPLALMDTMTLVYDVLSPTQITNWLSAVDTFATTVDQMLNGGTSTGANRVEVCAVFARRGILGKSSAKLTSARNGLSPVFAHVRTGDGFYADGSFIQHGTIPYLGNYGATLLANLAGLFGLLAGSTWAVTDAKRQIVLDAVTDSWAPYMYNGLLMDGVSGRVISRGILRGEPPAPQQDDHTRGHGISASILQLAEGATVQEATTWKSMVKGWIQREYWGNLADDATLGLPALAQCLDIRDDTSVSAAPESVGHRLNPSMDRAVHRRPGWAASVSMCSGRTTYYETGNGDNLKGWHTSNGMLYYWGSTWGNGQYSDAFWPTVDPYRLPGITVSKKTLANGAGGAWGVANPGTVWVGGASDGTHAALGQDTRGLQSTLRAKKSWFFLDDTVVCLGAGITCTDGVPVETVVDNRNLGSGSGSHAFSVNGTTQPTTMGWSATLAGTTWAHQGDYSGYVFLAGATIKALREERTGRWSDISTVSSTTELSRKYLTVYLDHGVNPTNASYSYLLLPGASASETAARAADPTVTVLANTSTIQAISDSATGVTAANFFSAGTAGPVTVSAPCSVLMREADGRLHVAVADPTRSATTITVTIARDGYATATGDSQISVTGLDPITLVVETGGSLGTSRTITLGAGSAVSGGQHVSLSPAADSFVRDGSYAATNYGADTLITVKNNPTGYARRGYLKFDLGALPAVPRRAVLWLSGNTNDSAGSHTDISAYAVSSDNWTEAGITWNTAPPLGARLATAPLCDVTDWIPLDVTSFVEAQPAGDGTISIGLWQETTGLATMVNSRSSTSRPAFLQVITG
ncbi:polysaccharide lyase family 8 super-sandwich domain-containing protein [Streptomyces sp. NPDC055709]